MGPRDARSIQFYRIFKTVLCKPARVHHQCFSKIAVSLGDINGNWVQRLIAYDTGESLGGYDRTFVSSNLFTINSANGNYYLILEVDSGATSRGLNATIEMNGCYLI